MKTILKAALGAAAMPLALVITAGNSVAQTNRLPGPKLVSGQAMEVIGRAATVVKTVHYQAMIGLSCSNIGCDGSFRGTGKNRRLNITRMSCVLVGVAGSTYRFGEINLENAQNPAIAIQLLPVDFSSADGIHTLNRAVDMEVSSGRHIYVVLVLSTGNALSATCAATGTLSVLK